MLISFGKYKGNSINYICKINRSYIEWLISNIWFKDKYNELYNYTIIELKKDNKEVINNNDIIIYTDGACPNNGYINAKCGMGIHYSLNNIIKLNDISQELYVDKPTNNYAELMAINTAINNIIKNKIKNKIIIYTDSKYCINVLLKWYKNWVLKDSTHNKANIKLIKDTYNNMQKINIQLLHIKAHSNNIDEHSIGNSIADKLARNSIKSI